MEQYTVLPEKRGKYQSFLTVHSNVDMSAGTPFTVHCLTGVNACVILMEG